MDDAGKMVNTLVVSPQVSDGCPATWRHSSSTVLPRRSCLENGAPWRRRGPVGSRKRRSGSLLLEIMGALTLLVVGAFSVFVLLLISIQSDSESAHYSMARAAAQQQLEWARQSVFSSLSSTAVISPSTASLPPGAIVSPLTITPNSGGVNGLTLVSITITWTEPGRGQDSITMDTYVVSGGINQH